VALLTELRTVGGPKISEDRHSAGDLDGVAAAVARIRDAAAAATTASDAYKRFDGSSDAENIIRASQRRQTQPGAWQSQLYREPGNSTETRGRSMERIPHETFKSTRFNAQRMRYLLTVRNRKRK